MLGGDYDRFLLIKLGGVNTTRRNKKTEKWSERGKKRGKEGAK
jgi:hypothetical protein